LCGGGKTKCANVRLAEFQNIFPNDSIKIKHEALGCGVGKKSAVKFICRPVVSILSVSLMVVVSVFTLAYYVLREVDVALCCACGKAILLTRC
jgi:hypothetical protein